jgi:hypothetical protein
MLGRKKLLAVVAAVLYTQSKDGYVEGCVEEADHLIEAVRKYKRKRPTKEETKAWEEFAGKNNER